MKIRNKLYISAGISIVLVVILLSVVLVTSGRIAEGNKKHETADDMYKGVSELDLLTYDYLLHREERMEQQWNSKYDSLEEILDEATEEEGLKSIRTDYTALGSLFLQITANSEKIQELIQEGASQKEIEAATGLEERLVALLLIASQSVFTGASTLAEEAQVEVMAAQRLAAILTPALMIVLVVAITTSSLLIARSISKPLDKLTKGAEIIGIGNLEHKVEVQSKDELGELAAAFNKMTASLKEITASRDELDREITVRKQAQENLTASEARYHGIFDYAGEAIVTFDKAEVVQSWNKAAEDMLGYKAEEMIGRTFHSIVPDDLQERGELERLREESEKSGRIFRYETQRVRKDGARLDIILTRSALRNDEGNITGFIAVLSDITERKRAEEELQKVNTELTAVNKELEAFSYSVSHDLRAPLRSIDGFSQALLEDYPDRLDEQGKGYLQRVRSATQRMGILIDDLLSLSRVTRSEMRRETVDLSALAQSIAEELQETQPERQDTFVIAPGQTTSGDSQLLRLLMENLISNAWKYTGHHPQARIEFGVTQVDGKKAFFVRDDGAGFDMAYVDKLFGVFQRLHAQEEFPGTGIGLATVQRIAHRHGGQVWAEGKVEEGATFYFTLE